MRTDNFKSKKRLGDRIDFQAVIFLLLIKEVLELFAS